MSRSLRARSTSRGPLERGRRPSVARERQPLTCSQQEHTRQGIRRLQSALADQRAWPSRHRAARKPNHEVRLFPSSPSPAHLLTVSSYSGLFMVEEKRRATRAACTLSNTTSTQPVESFAQVSWPPCFGASSSLTHACLTGPSTHLARDRDLIRSRSSSTGPIHRFLLLHSHLGAALLAPAPFLLSSSTSQ